MHTWTLLIVQTGTFGVCYIDDFIYPGHSIEVFHQAGPRPRGLLRINPDRPTQLGFSMFRMRRKMTARFQFCSFSASPYRHLANLALPFQPRHLRINDVHLFIHVSQRFDSASIAESLPTSKSGVLNPIFKRSLAHCSGGGPCAAIYRKQNEIAKDLWRPHGSPGSHE